MAAVELRIDGVIDAASGARVYKLGAKAIDATAISGFLLSSDLTLTVITRSTIILLLVFHKFTLSVKMALNLNVKWLLGMFIQDKMTLEAI